jgi:transcriptional regulator with XRE-family HTH domain
MPSEPATLSDVEVRAIFAQKVREAGGTAKVARLMKLSRSYIYQVINGQTTISPKILKLMGLTPITVYIVSGDCGADDKNGDEHGHVCD